MPIEVDYGGTIYEFPDGTSEDVMRRAMLKVKPTQAEPKSRQISREVLQGLSFGFGDEMTAGVNAGIGALRGQGKYGDLYSKEVEAERAALHSNRAQFPKQSFAANIAGGLPLMAVPGLNAGKAASTWQAVKAGAKVGAASGALAGFGTGEGGVTERLPGAAVGGTVGGVLGGAIPAVGAAYRGVKGALAPAQVKADRKILQNFDRDSLTPEAVETRLGSFGSKPATIADAAGDNTRGLTDAAFLGPSAARPAARETLERRAAEQSARIVKDLAATSGTNADRLKTVEQLRTIRTEAAAPLYEQAYKEGAAGVDSPELRELLTRPRFVAAYQKARELAQLEAKPRKLPEIYKVTPTTKTSPILSPNGVWAEVPDTKVEVIQQLDLHTLDDVKRGLDEIIFAAKAPTSGVGGNERRLLGDLRNTFVNLLDEKFPSYKAARDAFAGPARMEEALQAGADFAAKDSREIAQELAKDFTSQSDRQYYLIGAMDALRKRGINDVADGADTVKRVFGSPEKRAQIKALFPDKGAFSAFEKRMKDEATLRSTQDYIRGNSRTAQRLTEQADAAGEAVHAGAALARGNPVPAGAGILSRLGMGKVDANNLLPTLINTNPAMNRAALQRLAAQRQIDALGRRGGILGPTFGGLYSGQLAGGILGQR